MNLLNLQSGRFYSQPETTHCSLKSELVPVIELCKNKKIQLFFHAQRIINLGKGVISVLLWPSVGGCEALWDAGQISVLIP